MKISSLLMRAKSAAACGRRGARSAMVVAGVKRPALEGLSAGGTLCIPMRSIILVMYGPKSRVIVLASICGSRNEYEAVE